MYIIIYIAKTSYLHMHTIINYYSNELPEIQASSKLDSILCNGDLSEPESDFEECFGRFSITKYT